jgi:hypothetical protein
VHLGGSAISLGVAHSGGHHDGVVGLGYDLLTVKGEVGFAGRDDEALLDLPSGRRGLGRRPASGNLIASVRRALAFVQSCRTSSILPDSWKNRS